MSLLSISNEERRRLIAAVRTVYQTRYAFWKPMAKAKRGERNWASITEIDNELKPFVGTGKFKRFVDGKQASENRERTLNPLAKYAGYTDFAAFRNKGALPAPTQLTGRSRGERLQQGYETLLSARVAAQAGALPSTWVTLLAHERAGIDDFLKAYVDLNHLHGYYGQLLDAFMQKQKPGDNQNDRLFGLGVQYYRAFLAEDGAAMARYWQTMQKLHLGTSVPAFTHGRWAFALIIQATGAATLAQVLAELKAVAVQPPNVEAGRVLPPPYNYFPAGFQFLVCEALFLRQEWSALLEWLDRADSALRRVEFTCEDNVFGEVMLVWRAMALICTGQDAAANTAWGGLRPSLNKVENRWLWDYYEVYWWLADLQFAVAGISSSNQEKLRNKITFFAKEYQRPFFQQIEQRISPKAKRTPHDRENIKSA